MINLERCKAQMQLQWYKNKEGILPEPQTHQSNSKIQAIQQDKMIKVTIFLQGEFSIMNFRIKPIKVTPKKSYKPHNIIEMRISAR